MRKTIRLFTLVGLAAAGMLASLFLHPDVRAREARFDACAEDLSAACLADLGAEMGLSGKPPLADSDGIRTLQLLGRDDTALALVERSLELGRTPDIDALGGPESYLSPVRIARSIDHGLTPAEAYSTTPGARYLHLTHALHLLREPPFGTGRHLEPLSARQRKQTAQTATFLETLAESLQPGWRSLALEMAMELHLKLGDPDSVRRLFDRIDWGNDWHGNLSEGLIAVLGVDHALSKCRTTADCRINLYRRAALVEASPAEAERMLRLAFAQYRDRASWPDFNEMEEVVGLALQRGDGSLALEFAQELDQLSQTRSYVFPSFPHIVAARALLAAGGTIEDVRAALDRAEAEMPGNGGAVIGLGHIGPITWGGGIGSQVRWEQASLRAQIGEVERAVLLLDGINDPAYAWGEVVRSDLPPEKQDRLLAAASDVLDDSELLRLLARLTGPIASNTSSAAQKVRAAAIVSDVIARVDLNDERTVWVCHSVSFVHEEIDPQLKRKALNCVGQAALRSRDADLLLLAAGLWSAYEAADR